MLPINYKHSMKLLQKSMKLLQQNLIASRYIPFCTLSINAIIRWKSLSVA